MQEIIGKHFGKWIVTNYEGKFHRVHKFKVKCECGNESISDYISLTRGKSTQCRSCARKKSSQGKNNASYKHGYSSVSHPYFKVYTAWCSMKSRCFRKLDKNYSRYGGKGISVCKSWIDNFENFLSDMGLPEEGQSLDRINVYGNYCKENCRWASQDIQHNNCRRSIYHTYNKEKLSETQWSRKLGISRNKIMWWARKNGIQWVIENLDIIKKTKRGMSDQEYSELELDLPKKIYRK